MRDVVEIVEHPNPVDTSPPWTIVARADTIARDRGVAALVEGEPVAVFRLEGSGRHDDWFAVSHTDPVTQMPVMARGLVGSHGDELEVPTIASPLHKRRYDLRTGECLDDDTPALAIFRVRVIDGWVLVA